MKNELEGKKFICKQCGYISNALIEPSEDMVCPTCDRINKGYLINVDLPKLVLPTEEEKEIASYSKYGYIQPHDHEVMAILTIESNGVISYKVNEAYKNFYKIFKQVYNINNNYTHIWMNKYNPALSILYKIFAEDPLNFSCVYYGLMELEDVEDLYDVYLCISDSLKDSFKSNSVTYKHLYYAARKEVVVSTSTFLKYVNISAVVANRYSRQTNKRLTYKQMEDLIEMTTGNTYNKKSFDKFGSQTSEERDLKLKLAEEKRERKRLKKLK